MTTLKDRTAIITGASSGIGKGIALAFAEAGASLVITYNESRQHAHALADTIREKQGRVSVVKLDLRDTVSIERLIHRAQEVMGRIDILVNNAGANILTGHGASLSDQEKLQQLVEVDLKGTVGLCWAVLPVMQQQRYGVIINMAWDLALHGFPGINPQLFALTKAGILGFSRALAKGCGPDVRVNILSPGWIETAFAKRDMSSEYYQQRCSEIPLNRFGQPGDVAAAAVFLASDAASYMTGEAIKINGGLS